MTFFAKKVHLPERNYLGRRTYFVTICTAQRRPVFGDHVLAQGVLACLRECAARANFSLHAFCVMPDHVHFGTEGLREDCALLGFVNAFKQKTGVQYRARCGETLWQKRFHNYILRRGDAIEDIAAYIWMNPVRKGLCCRPEEYPLSGSMTIDWMSPGRSGAAWKPPWRVEGKLVGVGERSVGG
jgi:putative transposase